MEHVALMKKSWGLTEKILTGKKKLESRWYKTKYLPWNKIKAGDIVYFKNSGEPVTIKSEVEKVLQFSDLNENKVHEILEKYRNADSIEKEDFTKFFSFCHKTALTSGAC